MAKVLKSWPLDCFLLKDFFDLTFLIHSLRASVRKYFVETETFSLRFCEDTILFLVFSLDFFLIVVVSNK